MPLGMAHFVTPGFIPVPKATRKNLSADLQTVALAKDCRHDTYYIPIVRTVVAGLSVIGLVDLVRVFVAGHLRKFQLKVRVAVFVQFSELYTLSVLFDLV